MAVPVRLSRKLRDTLGPDAGGDLVTWLDEMRADHARTHTAMAAMEARLIERFDKVDSRFLKVDERLASMDDRFAKMDDRFSKMDDRFAKMDERMANLLVATADSKAELMKWMLVFWVGAVGAIAALAGVLRQ